MTKRTHVENIGEAISVLIQTAELAQKSGILSFDDAVVVKSSIDFLMAMNEASQKGPQGPIARTPETEQVEEKSA